MGEIRLSYLLEIRQEGDEGAVALLELQRDGILLAVRLQRLLGDVPVRQADPDPQLGGRPQGRNQRHQQDSPNRTGPVAPRKHSLRSEAGPRLGKGGEETII